ncbi:unnamed protein product, partial [Closterium sp. NIES-53]
MACHFSQSWSVALQHSQANALHTKARAGRERQGPYNPQANAFYVEERVLRTGGDGMRDVNNVSSRHWLRERQGPYNPQANAFYVEERVLRTGGDGMRDVNNVSSRHWL